MDQAPAIAATIEVTSAADPDAAAWQGFVDAHGAGRHELAWPWRQVLTASFGHRSCYLQARRLGRIVGVLPLIEVQSRLFGRALISTPHLNGGGLLALDEAAAAALLAAAGDLVRARRCRYGELRQGQTLRATADLAWRQHKVTLCLPLPADPDVLLAGFKAKLRSQIRRPEKAGAEALVVSGSEVADGQLAAFYRVFAATMRDLGTPVLPAALFAQTLQQFGERALLGLVWLDGAPVAGGLLVGQGPRIEIIWAASRRACNPLSVNMLLYWAVLRRACELGYRSFDFGRCTPGSPTFRFKTQWGAQPVPLPWVYLPGAGSIPDISPDNPRFRLAVQAWRRLPLALTNRLGPMLAPSLP